MGTTYFWRVDEVNDAQTPTTWAGNIWNFTTIDSIVVEDFEAYNDIPETEEGSNLVYYTWVDGYVDPPQVRTNGSTMGYTIPFEPTMEFGVVHGGAQSAPLDYDNTVASYSEVTANVSDLQFGPDWSQYGIGTLTVWYYGDPNNAAQQLYVKVNNNKILHGNPESLKQASWQPWPIDLTPYNVSNVTTLTIGLDRLNGVGGKGIILLDDIELGAAPPEVGSISQIENFNPLDTSNMQEVEGW